MITNKFYIATIIAIFLSLSLGILIGGTLGQQWINENQQNLIKHYEAKSEELKQVNQDLLKKQENFLRSNQKLKEDFKELFMVSIKGAINERKILWINDSTKSFEPLRKTLELAGGDIYEIEKDVLVTLARSEGVLELENKNYDVVLFFPTNKEALPNYKWLLQYNVPVIYVTDKKIESVDALAIEIDIYEKKVNVDSLNEHFHFVYFLKNLILGEMK